MGAKLVRNKERSERSRLIYSGGKKVVYAERSASASAFDRVEDLTDYLITSIINRKIGVNKVLINIILT